MKSIITQKPHLTARVVISLILQILLMVLLSRPHQDSTIFNIGNLVIAVLAMVPVAFAPRWLNVSTLLMLQFHFESTPGIIRRLLPDHATAAQWNLSQ